MFVLVCLLFVFRGVCSVCLWFCVFDMFDVCVVPLCVVILCVFVLLFVFRCVSLLLFVFRVVCVDCVVCLSFSFV